jgi:hypothetical protein
MPHPVRTYLDRIRREADQRLAECTVTIYRPTVKES